MANEIISLSSHYYIRPSDAITPPPSFKNKPNKQTNKTDKQTKQNKTKGTLDFKRLNLLLFDQFSIRLFQTQNTLNKDFKLVIDKHTAHRH